MTIFVFFLMSSFLQFFNIQMSIFRKVRVELLVVGPMRVELVRVTLERTTTVELLGITLEIRTIVAQI